MATFVDEVRLALERRAEPLVKEGAERYFKHVVRFHGVKAPAVKQVAREVLPLLREHPIEDIVRSAFQLLSSEFSEEKQIAVIVLNRHLRTLPNEFLTQLEPVFEASVCDWGTCDAIAGRVLRFLLTRSPAEVKRVVSWSASKNLWRQRASAVAFVSEARHGRHNEQIITVCRRVVRNPERFAQLGAGWVLRELFLADRERVLSFLREHSGYISREGLRYAIEKMPAALQKQMLAEHTRARRR
ncbi:MAG TPA: DNA alkylation repair protein [Planctomycetota bacterium]|jgi:3-methyladenine DNA glycosylase AlkD